MLIRVHGNEILGDGAVMISDKTCEMVSLVTAELFLIHCYVTADVDTFLPERNKRLIIIALFCISL